MFARAKAKVDEIVAQALAKEATPDTAGVRLPGAVETPAKEPEKAAEKPEQKAQTTPPPKPEPEPLTKPEPPPKIEPEAKPKPATAETPAEQSPPAALPPATTAAEHHARGVSLPTPGNSPKPSGTHQGHRYGSDFIEGL